MAETISFDDFGKLELRVGTVAAVEKVPDTDKLYALQVDLGKKTGTRQLVSSIAGEYTPDQLQGKQIVVLVNLEEKTFRGATSQGMLLAAVKEDNEAVLLVPDKPVLPGTKVS